MSAGFDPYHRWLSIPSSDQPPTHYRILGLPLFESDPQVIENAAMRQIAHVRSFLETPLRAYAVNLIHELSVARQCLIKFESKAAYDAWLRQRTPTPPLANSTPRPHFIESPPPKSALQTSVRRRSTIATKQTAKSVPAKRAELSSNDWIDATPVDNVPKDFWPSEHENASPDFDFQPRLSIKRRRKKSPLATLFNLAMWVVGTAAGILAGYAILCIMDAKYDYLNLFNAHKAETSPIASPATPHVDPSLPAPAQPKALLPRPQKLRNPSITDRHLAGVNTQTPLPGQSEAIESDLQPSATPTSPEADALDSLPSHVPLPEETITDHPTVLTSIPDNGAEQATSFELVDGGDNEKGRISLSVPESSTSEHRWPVEWSPISADGGNVDGHSTEIGAFTIDNHVINFAWRPDAPAAAAAALRNSLLQLTVGSQDRAIALREPEIGPPLIIDLKSPVARATCKCASPPKPADVKVDVVNLVDFPPYRVEGQGLSGLKLGDKVTLWYTDVEGVATRISLVRFGSLAAIQAESRYRLPSGDEEGMSVLLGNRKQKQLQKKCDEAVEARGRIPAIQHYLDVEAPSLLSAAKNINTMQHMPSGAYVENPTLALEKRQSIARINRDIDSATKELSRLNNLADELSDIQSDLATLEKISELAQRIQNARLCYRFYHVVGQHEVELVSNE